MAWKMENNQITLNNGNPVWIYDDGKEISVDYQATVKKIAELNEESKTHRLKAKELTEQVAKYADLDIEKARKAIETMQNLDDKKLVDAKQVDVLKKQWADDTVKANQKWEQEKIALSEALKKEKSERESLIKKQMFSNSKTSGFLNRVNLTPDVAFALWGNKFKIEGDKVMPMLSEDTPLPSSDPLKSYAGFDEGLEKFFNQYEYKDNYLKQAPAGSGSAGNSGGGSSGIVLTKLDAKNPAKYRAAKEQSEKTGQPIQII